MVNKKPLKESYSVFLSACLANSAFDRYYQSQTSTHAALPGACPTMDLFAVRVGMVILYDEFTILRRDGFVLHWL